MDPERWQQIDQLFHSALKCEPAARAAFLQASIEDEALRHEVESLVESHEQSDSFIEAPATDLAAELLAGTEEVLAEGETVGPYKIVSQLGKGGMGEVYLAEDMRLGRQVALKRLPAHFTLDAERVSRFEQEARAASALNHPNIVTIYEIVHSDSQHFITTEFIEGETLREHMSRNRMKLDEVLDISIQIATALESAHAAGIVHRDIKPENLMVRPDGYVKVLDFGLVKLVERENKAFIGLEEATTRNQTARGVILGTVNYMSPEQAKGERVDERTDIFSFGVVIYEMVAGKTPFTANSTPETLANLLKAEPQPLSASAGSVPEELQRIVEKTLLKDTDQRYQSMKEVLTDLKALRGNLTADQEKLARSSSHDSGIATGVIQPTKLTASGWTTVLPRQGARAWGSLALLIGLAIVINHFWINGRQKQPETAAAMRTIAVLPFKSIGAEGDNEYVELGMADALITRLSNIRGIVVRPTSSVSRYAGLQQDAVISGRELGVDVVLDGSVQKISDRIRVTVRLIRTKDAASMWAETFDEKWTDVLNVQSSIAQKMAGALALQLTGEEIRLLSKRYTDNVEAYQLYLKGRYSSNKWTTEGFRKAIEYYNRAIALDPGYALAYAGIADCYYMLSTFYMPPREVMPKLKEMAMKALALDESLAEAHASLSIALEYHDMDWSGAEKEIKRAVELSPNNSQVHLAYGDLLSNLGRFNEATSEFKTAQELDPTSAVTISYLAYHFGRTGDYDRAITESQKALELEPDAGWPLGALGFAYLYKGEPAKALGVFQKLTDDHPGGVPTMALEGIGRSYAAMGERSRALRIIDELKEASKSEYVSSYPIATIYLQLGDKNKAIEYLEKTYEERNTNSLFLLKTDRQFDVLRSDPRFIKLMRQLNFEP
jgi:serine/threonine protein kinase/TolB-like protein/Flp pilus assembly protein TadD